MSTQSFPEYKRWLGLQIVMKIYPISDVTARLCNCRPISRMAGEPVRAHNSKYNPDPECLIGTVARVSLSRFIL